MKVLKPYCLRLTGLAIGYYEYNYELSNDFFSCFPEGDIQEADIKVSLKVEKCSTMLVLNFIFEGYFKTLCDRCLKTIECPIDFEDDIIVRFAENVLDEKKEDDDALWWISPREEKLDLSQYLYESVALQRPIQYFCPTTESGERTCDNEVVGRLEALEETSEEVAASTLPDSALEVLKKMKFKD